jgi:hypothetical protein
LTKARHHRDLNLRGGSSEHRGHPPATNPHPWGQLVHWVLRVVAAISIKSSKKYLKNYFMDFFENFKFKYSYL